MVLLLTTLRVTISQSSVLLVALILTFHSSIGRMLSAESDSYEPHEQLAPGATLFCLSQFFPWL